MDSRIPVRAFYTLPPKDIRTPLHPLTPDIIIVHLAPFLGRASRSALCRVSKSYRHFFLPLFYTNLRFPSIKPRSRHAKTRIPHLQKRPTTRVSSLPSALYYVRTLTLSFLSAKKRELVYTSFVSLGTSSRLETLIFNPSWHIYRRLPSGPEFQHTPSSNAYKFFSQLKELVIPSATVCRKFAWGAFNLGQLEVLEVADGVVGILKAGVKKLEAISIGCHFPWYWGVIWEISKRHAEFPSFRRFDLILMDHYFVPAKAIGELWAESLNEFGYPRWKLVIFGVKLLLTPKNVVRLLRPLKCIEHPRFVRPWEFFEGGGVALKLCSGSEYMDVWSEIRKAGRIYAWELLNDVYFTKMDNQNSLGVIRSIVSNSQGPSVG
ncbi:hypothetical protein BDD12DRAFT_893031 [Trichophaea hybrida]|nr:hypothetical protein BDD12DRAFT_893031 [Trichophaea hybrida]